MLILYKKMVFHETITLASYSGQVIFVARILLAAIMILSGWPKIKNLKGTASNFDMMGFKPGMFWGTIIALVEFVGGIAILLGVYVNIAAALFGIQMLVGTLWKIKNGKGFKEFSYDLSLLVITLILLAFGAGSYVLWF